MHNYLLIGSGRLATHLRNYLSEFPISLKTWSRREESALLPDLLRQADVVLLAISDSALADWVRRDDLRGKTLVHFAGALVFDNAWCMHPLMTFPPSLYPAAFYREIPFVVDEGFPNHELFPFLQNPFFPLPQRQRPLYHALCNMAANFPALLWVQVINDFEKQLALPRALLLPLVRQSLQNAFNEGSAALTGPHRRGDQKTVELHERALEALPSLRAIHRSWNDWATKISAPSEVNS